MSRPHTTRTAPPDPQAVARTLRGVFASMMPQSFEDFGTGTMKAHQAYQLVREQCPDSSAEECRQATEDGFPELFADHWQESGAVAV